MRTVFLANTGRVFVCFLSLLLREIVIAPWLLSIITGNTPDETNHCLYFSTLTHLVLVVVVVVVVVVIGSTALLVREVFERPFECLGRLF